MKIYLHSKQPKSDPKSKVISQQELTEKIKQFDFGILQDKANKKTQLDKADIFIIEVSTPSTRAGYVIAYAIASRKPILCLYHESIARSDIDYLTDSASAKLLTLKEYNKDNIQETLSFYLRQKQKKEIVTTKFTLRVPPTIVEYLNWKKQFTSKSKASIIRDSFIEEIIEKDSKYQEYLLK